VAPLRLGEGVLGSLAAGAPQAGMFFDEDLEFLMVAADAAAQAFSRLPGADGPRTWGHRWVVPSTPAPEGWDAPLSFLPTTSTAPPQLLRRREEIDLVRTLRLVARRHLPSFRHAGRSLRCESGKPLAGRWDRRWIERMIGGLLSLALHLVPRAAITVETRSHSRQAAVEARYDLEGCPTSRADLASLTRAREEWELDFWLWRALARTEGGRLLLLQDRQGPVGIRLVLPH
jgi:hypothetical protein